MIDQAIFALLHVLVFVYWLGGDLGAFYTSRFLTQPGISPDRRMMAAKIVGDVDMAPRTALILMLPTGLALAQSKGWITLGWPLVTASIVAALIWLALAWKLHVAHGAASAWMKTLDLVIRWGVLAACVIISVLALNTTLSLPLFIALKLLLFSACIALGLLIRIVLRPLGPALMYLTSPEASEAEATLAHTLRTARPLVAGIWIFLIAAAFLGVWTPI